MADLTPKQIAKRIKAKGLGKLAFYCQMCRKQCRDANGFKNHMDSDGHRRAMAIFAEDADTFMNAFSKEFEKGYVDLLSRRYGSRTVDANVVYNEFIQDKEHMHMNSTIWPTLSDFVKYLGRTGVAEIEETERGWMVRYINRDPELLRRQEAVAAREAAEHEEARRREATVDALAAKARQLAEAAGGGAGGGGALDVAGAVDLHNRAEKIKIALKPGAGATCGTAAGGVGGGTGAVAAAGGGGSSGTSRPSTMMTMPTATAAAALFRDDDDDVRGGGGHASVVLGGGPATAGSVGHGVPGPNTGIKRSRWEMEGGGVAALPPTHRGYAPWPAGGERDGGGGNSRSRWDGGASAPPSAPISTAPPAVPPAGTASDVPWLRPGLIVKIVNGKMAGGKYMNLKAVVREVLDTWVGLVQVLSTGDTLKIDQAELQTVLPQVGGAVMVVVGHHAGALGKLSAVHTDAYCVDVELASGTVVRGLEYEHVCKLSA